MYRLNTTELSPLQIGVLLSALQHYAMHAKQCAVYCDSTDQPDLKRMWLARVDTASAMQHGVQ